MPAIPESGPIDFHVDHPALNNAPQEIRQTFADTMQYVFETGEMVAEAELDWEALGHSTSDELRVIGTLMELVRERRASLGTDAQIVRAYQRLRQENLPDSSKP